MTALAGDPRLAIDEDGDLGELQDRVLAVAWLALEGLGDEWRERCDRGVGGTSGLREAGELLRTAQQRIEREIGYRALRDLKYAPDASNQE